MIKVQYMNIFLIAFFGKFVSILIKSFQINKNKNYLNKTIARESDSQEYFPFHETSNE